VYALVWLNYYRKTKQKCRIFDKNLNFLFLTKIQTLFIAIKIPFFGCQNKSISQNEECHTSLSSLLNFQSNLNIFHFCHSYQKNLMYSLLKNKKIDKKIHFSKNAEDRKHGKQGAHSSRYFFCTP